MIFERNNYLKNATFYVFGICPPFNITHVKKCLRMRWKTFSMSDKNGYRNSVVRFVNITSNVDHFLSEIPMTIHTHMRARTHTHTHTYAHAHIRTHVCARTHAPARMRTHARMHARTYAHAYAHARTYVRTPDSFNHFAELKNILCFVNREKLINISCRRGAMVKGVEHISTIC